MSIKEIKRYILAFYDERGCFDEMRIDPYKLSDLEYAFSYISLPREELSMDYGRLFVVFDDGSEAEICIKEG